MLIESSETRDSGRVRQRMPRLEDAPVCLDQLTVEETPAQTSSSHVLVVDHDMNLCRQLSDYLGKNDFQVTAVNTGKQMLELIRRDGIDLLLLEPGLPGEDGLKLTKAIRESSSMPLVVLSERHEEADRVMGLELGADDYVTKPFSPRELLANSSRPSSIQSQRKGRCARQQDTRLSLCWLGAECAFVSPHVARGHACGALARRVQPSTCIPVRAPENPDARPAPRTDSLAHRGGL